MRQSGSAQWQRRGAGRDGGRGGQVLSPVPPQLLSLWPCSARLPGAPGGVGVLWGCPEPWASAPALAPADATVPPKVGDAEPELGAADSWIGVVPVGEEPAEVPRGAKEESFTATVVSKVTLLLAQGLPWCLLVTSLQGTSWGVCSPDVGGSCNVLGGRGVPDRPLLGPGRGGTGCCLLLAVRQELDEGTAPLPVLLPVLPSEPALSASADEASPGAGGVSPAHPGAEPERHPGGRRVPAAGPRAGVMPR